MLASGVRELARLKVADRGRHDLASLDLAHQSFRPRMTAFLSHRTLHKQYRERDHKRQHGDHPKGVEISKRRRLLLTQVIELLHSQLLGGGRIAVLLNEERLSPREKAAGGCVEGIKILSEP